MTFDVFISYPHEDKTTADATCASLEAEGIRCWIAPRDIVHGMDWGEAIIDALDGAKVMVLIFSGHANASPQIKREVERAVNKRIPIIPVRIEDVVPSRALEYFISTSHWLDALTPPLEIHLKKLADSVKKLLLLNAHGTDSFTPSPASADEPVVHAPPTPGPTGPTGRPLGKESAAPSKGAARREKPMEQELKPGNPGNLFVGAFILMNGALMFFTFIDGLISDFSNNIGSIFEFLVTLLVSVTVLVLGVATIGRQNWARFLGMAVCSAAALLLGVACMAVIYEQYPHRGTLHLFDLMGPEYFAVLLIVCAGAAVFYGWGWRSDSRLASKIPRGMRTFIAFVLFFGILNSALYTFVHLFVLQQLGNYLAVMVYAPVGLFIIIEGLFSYYCFLQFRKEFGSASEAVARV